jgi:hypothetical protein
MNVNWKWLFAGILIGAVVSHYISASGNTTAAIQS